MKKVLIGLLVIALIVCGGLFYVYSNMDNLVKNAIETAGTDALGTSVSVGSVKLDLTAGTASIYDFAVANPPGFSHASMMSFDELSVAIDLSDIDFAKVTDGAPIHITSIVARNPYVRYEDVNGSSNVDVLSERFASEESGTTDASESESNIVLLIDSVLVESINATMQSDRLPNPVDVELGDITLQNLRGTPEEIAEQVMKPVMSQVSGTVGKALLSSLAGLSVEDLEEQVDERLDDLEDSVNDRIDEAIGEDLRKGLGNLLKR